MKKTALQALLILIIFSGDLVAQNPSKKLTKEWISEELNLLILKGDFEGEIENDIFGKPFFRYDKKYCGNVLFDVDSLIVMRGNLTIHKRYDRVKPMEPFWHYSKETVKIEDIKNVRITKLDGRSYLTITCWTSRDNLNRVSNMGYSGMGLRKDFCNLLYYLPWQQNALHHTSGFNIPLSDDVYKKDMDERLIKAFSHLVKIYGGSFLGDTF
ncbi:MAG: hypothetical protein NXI00_01565 [Cytophagales bacterium]|nr:hypothetical protein [Cytophagales bacterium]